MEVLGQILQGVGGIGSLVCFILVIIKMFQRGQTALAIVSIVLYCCVIGQLIAFIYGWVKHRDWGLTNVMIGWTACVILIVIGAALHPVNYQQFQIQQGVPVAPGP